MRLIWIVVLILATLVNDSLGAKILGLFPLNAKSHSIMINAVLEELIARGHQLDVVTAFPLPPGTPNYTAIDISPGCDYIADVQRHLHLSSVFKMDDLSFWDSKEGYRVIGYSTTNYALKHPSVQRLMYADDQQYDLILVEQYYQDVFLMFAHKFQAPIISISTFGWNTYFDSMLGSFGAWAHVPHELFVVPDNMNFWQRMQNIYFCLLDKFARHYIYMPEQQALADKYFAHLPGPLPTLEELSRSVSVILQNTHSPMTSVKPNVPGIVDVGGLHIGPPKKLPQDIQKFIDEAKQGVIYFSLGTQILSRDLPPARLAVFQQVFNELPDVKVLWKWESDDVEQMPKNVLPLKWMPQNDILAHPRVKLFITHGGLLGTQEGIHHGVPMLGIPIYGDQHINTDRAALQGNAIKLQFSNVTVESLRWAISELMHNPLYEHKAHEFSRIFRDRPESAMDRTMYWIEYVLRFRGANHLRSTGRDLPWYSYLLLDIVGAITISVVATTVGIWIALQQFLTAISKTKLVKTE